jgi:NAD-dependent deacetylase
MVRQHIVFLTGAGISAESGMSTFRGKDGLWTNEEWAYLASTDALYNETQKCLDFYNWRRKQLSEVLYHSWRGANGDHDALCFP